MIYQLVMICICKNAEVKELKLCDLWFYWGKIILIHLFFIILSHLISYTIHAINLN